VQITSQPVSTGVRRRVTRESCPAFVLPRVRELPLRLEPVVADGFGGLVAGRSASCVATTTNHRRGALS
jgi:hypothetical protein